ncbi:hydrophobin 2 [Mycena metata]|uniref:Hydrophobin n=1 Tax=Mycena metata TaxID=1033252 RepID=A0AAD7N7C3_9AGAR|nr:hydrophobin 2 [Mycena metata]KAJ7868898.1 hydrophobin 2 [Mycena leptocephala]KAJ7870559.1 hydrophobin 2 [Mycena leptocephala]
MFSKLSIVVASVLITLAAAIPTGTPPPPITPPSSPQCCNNLEPSNSTDASAIAGLLGIDLTGLDVLVGLRCSSIAAVDNNCEDLHSGGPLSLNCDAPEKEWGGLIAINCILVTA